MTAIRLVACLFVLVQPPLLLAADVTNGGQVRQAADPQQQYSALLEDYNHAFDEYARAFREAKLPQDREKIIRDKYPWPEKWASKFLELAQKNPAEPFAEEALIWIVTSDARLRRFLPWHEHTPR